MSEHDRNPHEDEARERWGHTDAYHTSRKRTSAYTEEDWARIKGELEGIEAGFAAALRDGDPPDGERAVGLAEQARLHIDRWYYPCPHAMHAGLAEMYVADPRFKAHYDDREEGLAEFVAEAIRSNASRAAG